MNKKVYTAPATELFLFTTEGSMMTTSMAIHNEGGGNQQLSNDKEDSWSSENWGDEEW